MIEAAWIGLDARSGRAWAIGTDGSAVRTDPPKPSDIPVLACGTGRAPPVQVPAAPGTSPVKIEGVRHVPALSQSRPPALTDGDETRIAGFLRRNPKFDGTVIVEGESTTWAQVSAGEVVSFQTTLTGRLLSVLGGQIDEGWDAAVFAEAVGDGLSRPEALSARAAQIEADARLNGPDASSVARLTGLVIGAELAHAKPYWLGTALAVIAEPGGRIAAALETQGAPVLQARAETCTLDGLRLAWTKSEEPT